MTSILQDFYWRIRLAALAFVQAPSLEPIIKLKNGGYIDLNSRKIILTENTHIHCKGDLILSSDKHVMIESGKDSEEREGYTHSVWFNPQKDNIGRPVMLAPAYNKEGKLEDIELVIEDGKRILPAGWKDVPKTPTKGKCCD